MYNYVDIDLRNGADDVCSVYSIGREGENLAYALRVYIPDKFLNCSIVFEFEIADGSKYISRFIPYEEVIEFPLLSFITVEGMLKIAVIAVEVNTQRIMKPFEKTFVVSGSISAFQSQGYEYIVAADHENRISDNENRISHLESERVEISEIDNGKFMRARNGHWVAETVPNAEEEWF